MSSPHQDRKGLRRTYLSSTEPVPRTTSWRWKRRHDQTGSFSHLCVGHDESSNAAVNPAMQQQLVDNHHNFEDLSTDIEIEQMEQDMSIDSDPEVHSDTDHEILNEDTDGSFATSEQYMEPEDPTWINMDKPLFGNIQTTVAEAVLLIISFVLKYNLPWTAMEDLFKLINVIFGQYVLPHTKYMISKLFGGMNSGITFHLYCPQCQHYLGCRQEKGVVLTCDMCWTLSNTGTLIKNGNFFATIPIGLQLTNMLKSKPISEALVTRLNEIHGQLPNGAETLKDISDGALYTKKRRELKCSKDDLTITINTDGSPVFKSSKTSMWPLQLIVNELPPKLRWENPLVCGLWFGPSHPNMKLFLKVFIEEMVELSKNAIRWSSNEQNYLSRVFAICACVDSPARAAVQNTTQFNGFYGCSWCLHPGVTIDGSQVKYTVQKEIVKDRTNKSMLVDMKLAIDKPSPVNGVKGPSALINLPGFDIVWGFSPDYMHSLLLGVVRQITELWLSVVQSPWYIGQPNNLCTIDQRLLKIKTPHFITRHPRTITSRKYWKAAEWRNWLLYYSVPCLLGILERKFLKHWLLLVQASFLILKDEITFDDINQIDLHLSNFIIKTQMLYGEMTMTSNIHQLSHYAKSIKLLGPAWCRSAFVFESNNGSLLKQITAAKGVPMQVLNRYLFKMKLKCKLLDRNFKIRPAVLMSLHIMNSYNLVTNCEKITIGSNVIYMFGKLKCELSIHERAAFVLTTACPDFSSVILFNRMLIENSFYHTIYHSQMYTRVEKTNNTVICAFSNRYFIIKKFLSYSNDTLVRKCGAVCHELILVEDNVINLPTYMHRCEHAPMTQNLVFIDSCEIGGICVYVDIGGVKYVCNVPNMHERD